jgi:hypothetical protein
MPSVMLQLIDFGAYAVRNNTNAKGIPLEGVIPNCMEFGVKCLKHAVTVLASICTDKCATEGDFFRRAMQVRMVSSLSITLNRILVRI